MRRYRLVLVRALVIGMALLFTLANAAVALADNWGFP